MSGELVGSITDKLFDQGALDVFTTPIYMKQNRPAVKISVLCRIQDIRQLEQILFEQAVTFGIRKQILQKSKLAKDFVGMRTEFGRIKIKTGSLDGKIVNAKPEFSDCLCAAKKHNVSVKAVLDAAINTFRTRR